MLTVIAFRQQALLMRQRRCKDVFRQKDVLFRDAR